MEIKFEDRYFGTGDLRMRVTYDDFERTQPLILGSYERS